MSDDSEKAENENPIASGQRSPLDLPPIFVHSEVDDLGLTVNAFRVYAHLARRAGKDNLAWPSYSTIGEHCFRASYPKAQEATLRRRAIEAVNELKDRGLIHVEQRRRDNKGHTSNAYRLLTLRQRREFLVARDRQDRDHEASGDPVSDIPF